AAQLACEVVVRTHVLQFVAEGGEAAGFEADERYPVEDGLAQRREDGVELAPGLVEHAEVEQRPAAAEMLARHDDVEAGVFEHLDRGLRRLRIEMVVE